ncbi:MAG: asparaginase [Variibacter sp.]
MTEKAAKPLPKIVVIACGGTIGSLSPDTLDVVDYPEQGKKVPVAALLARVPEAARIANVEGIDFRAVSSSAIGPAEWLELRATIERLVREGAQGIVVLHGTGTLEETAFFLHLVWSRAIPIVLTGAQRPPSAVSSDAGMNLISSLRVAADPASRDKGVMVVLNDEIFPARDVVKTSTFRLQTFQALGLGPIGCVDGDGVFFRRTPVNAGGIFSGAIAQQAIAGWPRVDVVYSYAGADGVMIDAAVQAGARGVVSAGFAPGIPTPAERERLKAAQAAGIVVVQTSRAAGRVARRRALAESSIIPGEDFSPQKARILLSLCLAAGFDYDRTAAAFRDC